MPSNLIEPKMGFGIPLDKILINLFSSKIEYFLNSKEVEDQKIYNLYYIRKLWKEHKSQRETGNSIMEFFSFKAGIKMAFFMR